MRVLFLLISFLYASIIDTYIKSGSEGVLKELDSILSSKKYWAKKLNDKNLSLGYYEDAKYILVCNKEKRDLKLFLFNKDLQKLNSYDVLVGLMGDKKREGDLKTPIGVYKLEKLLNRVDKFYGPFAFETSYPNYLDRLSGKNGHGIWIHGMEDDRETNNTKGCIAMRNSDLRHLRDKIDYKKSYLLIYETPFFATKDDIASILAFLYRWRGYWQKSDFENYISLYSEQFKRDGFDYEKFYRYKKAIFNKKRGKCINIIFKNISIIPYQNSENRKIYRVDFYEIYKSPNYTFKGNKELYLEKVDNKFKIISER